MEGLKAFLINLAPLQILHILLEGFSEIEILEEVLKVHSCSLRSLIWDERNAARLTVQRDRSVFNIEDFLELKLISQYCTQLKAIGLSIKWKLLKDDSKWPIVRYCHTSSDYG